MFWDRLIPGPTAPYLMEVAASDSIRASLDGTPFPPLANCDHDPMKTFAVLVSLRTP